MRLGALGDAPLWYAIDGFSAGHRREAGDRCARRAPKLRGRLVDTSYLAGALAPARFHDECVVDWRHSVAESAGMTYVRSLPSRPGGSPWQLPWTASRGQAAAWSRCRSLDRPVILGITDYMLAHQREAPPRSHMLQSVQAGLSGDVRPSVRGSELPAENR